VGQAVIENITDGPFAGLYALTQVVDIYARAEDSNGTVSAVVLRAKAQAIPIFQFGVFYDADLEVTNGPPMTFIGRVHSNGKIYLSSANAWYHEVVTTASQVVHDRKDNHSILNGVYVRDANAIDVPLSFDSRTIPGAEAFRARSCDDFDCRLQTEAFGVDSLRLPLPGGVPAIELIRPREGDDGPSEKKVKFAWNADAYVTVDLTDLQPWSGNCGDWPGNPPVQLPRVQMLRPLGRPVPNEQELCRMFKWQWSAFYDGREDELKDVVQVDLDEIDGWVHGDSTRAMEVVYVDVILLPGYAGFDTRTRNAVMDGSIDPAVRVVNGSQLPNRMTIATQRPLYVLGDYNSSNKLPAALVGDGITMLSTAWNDGQNRPGNQDYKDCNANGAPCSLYLTWANGWNMHQASATTVNAAILAGHWPTLCDHEEPGCTGGYEDFYGGGLENFPRFLEKWGSSVAFTYLGALVSPFTSGQTTGTWNLSYYDPPRRDWSFDTDFRNPALLPPGTPNVGSVIRTALREGF
jgi:hypothetical protein